MNMGGRGISAADIALDRVNEANSKSMSIESRLDNQEKVIAILVEHIFCSRGVGGVSDVDMVIAHDLIDRL